MKTKKILSVILAGIMIISSVSLLSACGEKYYSDGFTNIDWPDSKLTDMLSEPKSKKGMIVSNKENLLEVYIGDTSLDQYESYVSSCKEDGFTEEYDQGITFGDRPYYKAKNKDGYYLELEYHENDKKGSFHPMKNTMTIKLQDEKALAETTVEATTAKTTTKPTEKPTEKAIEKSTEAPKQSSVGNESKSKYADIYAENLGNYQALINKYRNKLNDVYNKLGNSYNSYVSNQAALDDWYSELKTDYTELYKETEEKIQGRPAAIRSGQISEVHDEVIRF